MRWIFSLISSFRATSAKIAEKVLKGRSPQVSGERRPELSHALPLGRTLSGEAKPGVSVWHEPDEYRVESRRDVCLWMNRPSGLHQRDNGAALGTLIRLRNLGNTVIVVER